METVKVDAQKLQMLNDRINQTIDALNQVRMSTHGLQHSPVAGAPGVIPQGLGQVGVGQVGFGAQPFGYAPYGYPMGLQQAFLPQQIGAGFVPNVPTMQWGLGAEGLRHSPEIEQIAALRGIDPYTAMRLSQTFPYAFSQGVPTFGRW